MTNGENLTRDLKRSVANQTRRTQTAMYLCGLEDGGIQIRVIFLKCFESLLEFVDLFWGTNRTNRCCCGHSSKSLSNKFVATAMNGKNKTRLFRIWFQLLSQVNDVRIDRACRRIVLVSPHRIKQSIATQCFYRMSDEVCQQRKLFRGEINQVAISLDFVTTNVDLDITELVNLRRRRWR